MNNKLLILVLATGIAAPAAAQNMPLPQFIERGTKLEKKGMLALLEKGEINALMTEMKAASEAVRAERLANEKAGRRGPYCPPADGKGARMSSQQLLAELRAIPAAKARTMSTRDGMRHLTIKRYPCPA